MSDAAVATRPSPWSLRAIDHALAFGQGALFGAGLLLSGMTDANKVLAFLDVGGAWDPALLFVMGAALCTMAVAWRVQRRMRAPVLFAHRSGVGAAGWSLPAVGAVDTRLVVGAALFGVGWGLGGFCPGPAVVAAGAGLGDAWVFGAAALAGMALHGRVAAVGDG